MTDRLKDLTADDILVIKKCGDLFKDPNHEAIEDTYRVLAKRFHPDRCDLTNAEDVIKHLNNLRARALKCLEEGTWEGSHCLYLTPASKPDTTIRIASLEEYSFELGATHIDRDSVAYIFNSEYEAFYLNAIERIGSMCYPDKQIAEEIAPFMPVVNRSFQTTDGNYCLVLNKPRSIFYLPDILRHYGEKLPDRHAAWVISRLCGICCYFEVADIVHNGLTIENCFVSPSDHDIYPLGGWWYAKKAGRSMDGCPKAVYDVMSPTTKSNKLASKHTDLEAAKLIGRQIIDMDSAPKPIVEFLNSGSTDAFSMFSQWAKALREAYGERKFVEMNISESDIYNML